MEIEFEWSAIMMEEKSQRSKRSWERFALAFPLYLTSARDLSDGVFGYGSIRSWKREICMHCRLTWVTVGGSGGSGVFS